MPYDNNDDIPAKVQDALPEHGQDIYREAYNSAWDQYEDPGDRDASHEETVHKVAWGAVKNVYEKQDGEWKKR